MTAQEAAPPAKKPFEFPHSLILIFGMIVLAQLASYVLPAGEFETEGRQVLPGTYSAVDAEPLPWHSFLTKIPKGLLEAGDIIFFVFLIGGVLGVLRATGTVDAVISKALQHAGSSRIGVVGGMMGLFVLGSATIGMAEEYLPFMPVLITLCLALGMDAVVALGIVVLGYGMGYGAATLNPFTVAIAQDIAGLTPTSGQWYRWILLGLFFLIGLQHLLSYARKIERDPQASLVADIDYSDGFEQPPPTPLTGPRLLILILFVLTIAVFALGSSEVTGWGWYLTELGALFMGLGIIAAVVARMHPNIVAREFCEGASELTAAALLIGFARTIEVILTDAQVIHTIVNAIAGLLDGAGASVAAVGMLLVQSVCNFLIPSGSGQAYVTMPIMAPLADLVGVERQVAVLAYQFGDGFTNMIVPTNAVIMGLLAYARIPYQRWFRFMVPLLLKVYLAAAVALVVAVLIGYR
ncbi:MAG: TIGR00366 family protein [Acidobacteriota bacterium]